MYQCFNFFKIIITLECEKVSPKNCRSLISFFLFLAICLGHALHLDFQTKRDFPKAVHCLVVIHHTVQAQVSILPEIKKNIVKNVTCKNMLLMEFDYGIQLNRQGGSNEKMKVKDN